MDFYELLGVSRNATEEEIKLAYRALAFIHHPDRNFGDKEAESRFKQIQNAHDTLIDVNKRARYNGKQPVKPQPKPVKKPFKFKDGMYIYDAVPPAFDIWGKPLSNFEKEEWRKNNVINVVNLNKPKRKEMDFVDSFAGKYETESMVNIR